MACVNSINCKKAWDVNYYSIINTSDIVKNILKNSYITVKKLRDHEFGTNM